MRTAEEIDRMLGLVQIRDLPQEIQDLIHKRQIEQGNDGLFEGNIGTFKEHGNFNWYETPEYHSLWWSLSLNEPIKDVKYYRNLKKNIWKKKFTIKCIALKLRKLLDSLMKKWKFCLKTFQKLLKNDLMKP